MFRPKETQYLAFLELVNNFCVINLLRLRQSGNLMNTSFCDDSIINTNNRYRPYILISIGILFVECIGVNFSPVVAYPQNHLCSGLPESLPIDVFRYRRP